MSCTVCNKNIPDLPVYECSSCHTNVHLECYGINITVNKESYRCDFCLLSQRSGQKKCVACPCKSGAFKPTSKGDWIHAVCALYLNVPFQDTTSMTGADERFLPKSKMKCTMCKKKKGSLTKCSHNKCTRKFHVTCGLERGALQEQNKPDGGLKLFAYCLQHIPNKVEKFFFKFRICKIK